MYLGYLVSAKNLYHLLKNQILHKLASEQQIKSNNSCVVIGCVFNIKINYKNVQINDF